MMSANDVASINEMFNFMDVHLLNALQAHASRVCCIDFTQTNSDIEGGTGFLINESWVITNYHVLKSVIECQERKEQGQPWTKPDEVKFRFGYRMSQGNLVPEEGAVFSLFKAGDEKNLPWLIAFSPDTPDGLDYAIVEINDHLGKRRGWINLSDQDPNLEQTSLLVILQHPHLEPMQFSMTANAKLKLQTNMNRVIYNVRTREGSSGGPCFDKQGNLIAIHRAENCGVPINAIGNSLRAKNITLPKKYIAGRQASTYKRGSSYAQLPPFRYRYLECLDSVRYDYRIILPGLREIRENNAKCETIMALLMGDGIAIPENQFMDSMGWLQTFGPMIKAGDRVGVVPPVRVAIRDNKLNLYETAARMVERFPEKDPEKRFILSSYPAIDREYDMRMNLAEYLRALGSNREVKINPTIEKQNKDWGLMQIVLDQIQYFNTVDDSILQAEYTPGDFSEELKRVCMLDDRIIESDLLKALGSKFNRDIVKQIIEVVKCCMDDFKIKAKPPKVDITTRSEFFLHLQKYRKEITTKRAAKGAEELINSIYNFLLSRNVHATSYSDNTGGDADNHYIYTGQKIAEYLRLNRKITGSENATRQNWGWQAPTEQYFPQPLDELINEKQGEDIRWQVAEELPWDDVLEIFKDDVWQISLDKYLATRREFEAVQKILIEYPDLDLSTSLNRVHNDRYNAMNDAFKYHLYLSGIKIGEQSSGWKFNEDGITITDLQKGEVYSQYMISHTMAKVVSPQEEKYYNILGLINHLTSTHKPY